MNIVLFFLCRRFSKVEGLTTMLTLVIKYISMKTSTGTIII